MRNPDRGVQQPKVIVDFSDGSDRGAGAAAGRLLFDGNRWAQAVDAVDVRALHLIEELAGVGGERLDIAALSFGVDGVEGQRRLP